MCLTVQAYGCMEFRQGNLDKARELFQQGVWADPSSRGVTAVWQVSCLPAVSQT